MCDHKNNKTIIRDAWNLIEIVKTKSESLREKTHNYEKIYQGGKSSLRKTKTEI